MPSEIHVRTAHSTAAEDATILTAYNTFVAAVKESGYREAALTRAERSSAASHTRATMRATQPRPRNCLVIERVTRIVLGWFNIGISRPRPGNQALRPRPPPTALSTSTPDGTLHRYKEILNAHRHRTRIDHGWNSRGSLKSGARREADERKRKEDERAMRGLEFERLRRDSRTPRPSRKVFAVKVTPSRPPPDIRSLCQVPTCRDEHNRAAKAVRRCSFRVASLHQPQRRSDDDPPRPDKGVTDEPLVAAVDAIEAKAWGLAVERPRTGRRQL